MRSLSKKNGGYITIEMCLVIPIVIGIVMLLVMLILQGLDEGRGMGLNQTKAYTIEYDSDSGKWDMCTDRLRRWQLYGDVLCE